MSVYREYPGSPSETHTATATGRFRRSAHIRPPVSGPGAFFFCPAGSTLAVNAYLRRPLMPENKWAAVGPDWYREAACRNTNSDLFIPDIESAHGLEYVKGAYCNGCPVRYRCLQFAVITGDRGYWGGTSTAERLAMKRVRTRARCPIVSCRAPEPVAVGEYQICLSCAASWPRELPASRPEAV